MKHRDRLDVAEVLMAQWSRDEWFEAVACLVDWLEAVFPGEA